MNDQQTNTNDQLASVTLATCGPPLWRLRIVRLLQLLGIAAAFLGGADCMQLTSLLSPELAKWLLVSGPAFTAAIRPLALFFGDWLDDGQRNDSFHFLAYWLMGSAFLILSTGCQGLTVSSPYGAFSRAKDGSVIYSPPAGVISIPIYPGK